MEDIALDRHSIECPLFYARGSEPRRESVSSSAGLALSVANSVRAWLSGCQGLRRLPEADEAAALSEERMTLLVGRLEHSPPRGRVCEDLAAASYSPRASAMRARTRHDVLDQRRSYTRFGRDAG